MKSIILISALLASVICKPATQPAEETPNSGVPGVFISVDTLNDLKNRARQNEGTGTLQTNQDRPYSSNAAPAQSNQQAATQILVNQPSSQQLLTNQQTSLQNQQPVSSNQQLVNRVTPQLIVSQQPMTSNQQQLMIAQSGNQLPFVVQQPNTNQYVVSNQAQPIILGQSSGQTTYAIPIIQQPQQSMTLQQQQPTIISGQQLLGSNFQGQNTNTMYAVVPINGAQNTLQTQNGNVLIPVQQQQQPQQQVLTVSG